MIDLLVARCNFLSPFGGGSLQGWGGVFGIYKFKGCSTPSGKPATPQEGNLSQYSFNYSNIYKQATERSAL